MNMGELLTRITIWAALAGYALGATYLLPSRGRRWAWTVGCLCLVVHVIFAFNYYHDWSQASAYADTARQTAEVAGISWGGGLYINYVLIVAWIMDVVWWWVWPDGYRNRPRLLNIIWQGFLIFIIFNATVVFKTGALRWIGLSLCTGILIHWWLRETQKAPLDSNYLTDKSATD